MGRARKRRSLATRRRLAERWLESGVTAREFAQAHGIGKSSLNRWVRELRASRRSDDVPTGFLEVTPVGAPSPTRSVRMTVGAVTLELDQLPPVEYVLALGGGAC